MLDPNKLRAMIQKRGLTQKEVAKRVRKRGGKLSPVKLNHLCNVAKPSDPKLSIVEGIAAVLQCSMMKLLSRKVESVMAAPEPEVIHDDTPPAVVETPVVVTESPPAIIEQPVVVTDAPVVIEQPAVIEPQQAVEITTVEPQQAVEITTEPEAVVTPPEPQT